MGRSAASATPLPAAPAPPPATAGRPRPVRAPVQLRAYVEQFSGELHDEEHIPSNVGQAARLWHGSGLSEPDFLALMFEARARTKARGNIQKRAAGEAGSWGLTNRMPYFFACLRDLLASAGRPRPSERAPTGAAWARPPGVSLPTGGRPP